MPTPLPYHQAIRDLLRQMDPQVWDWFGQQRLAPTATEALKFELLKSTYRLTREAHPALYAAADWVAQAMSVQDPITLYQSQSETLPNAQIVAAANEVHLVLTGKIDSLLTDQELRALFAHEFGHHVLHQMEKCQFLQAWDMLRATCLDAHVHPAFQNSFRNLCLYNEIFCDQVALEVSGSLDAVITMLVKVTMGATNVQPKDFLAQAREILSHAAFNASSEGSTHPETYIRARALELFEQKSPKLRGELARWIEGPIDLAMLDLLQQRTLSRATRALIGCLLKSRAIQTDLMLSHARLYFDRFSLDECENATLDSFRVLLKDNPKADSLTNYCCFVLLDFATADRELDELPLANALLVAESLGIKEKFMAMARKEMKLRKNQVEQCDRSKLDILKSAKPPAPLKA